MNTRDLTELATQLEQLPPTPAVAMAWQVGTLHRLIADVAAATPTGTPAGEILRDGLRDYLDRVNAALTSVQDRNDQWRQNNPDLP